MKGFDFTACDSPMPHCCTPHMFPPCTPPVTFPLRSLLSCRIARCWPEAAGIPSLTPPTYVFPTASRSPHVLATQFASGAERCTPLRQSGLRLTREGGQCGRAMGGWEAPPADDPPGRRRPADPSCAPI
jgi:hypothetical protein